MPSDRCNMDTGKSSIMPSLATTNKMAIPNKLNGISKRTVVLCTSKGFINAAIPITNNTFIILLPTTLPTAKSL